MSSTPDFFLLEYLAGRYLPGTLVPDAAGAGQRREAEARRQATEQARKKRRDHLLLFRR
jgi:hypothetical protein